MECKEIELQDVITDIAAGPFGSNLKVSCFVDSGFPIIDGANLKGHKVTDNLTKFVTEEKARSLSRSIAQRGEVVVTISGTLGQIAYIPQDSQYPEYLCSQRQFRVAFDNDRVYVPYLVFYFHTREGQSKILSFANQTGVPALAQPTKNFKKICLMLPSLEDQRRIASFGELINQKIDLNNQINDYLYELCKAYLANLLNAISHERTTVEHYCERLYSGGTPSTAKAEYWNGQLPWLSSGETRQRFIIATEKSITEEGARCSSTKLAHKGDVVMASAGQGFTRGQTSMLLFDTYVNQSVLVLSPKSNCGEYLLLQLANSYDALRAWSDSTSTRGSISGKLLRQFELPLLGDKQLEELTCFCRPLFDQIEFNLRECMYLSKLRDELLPRLMSDEIDVTNMSISR